MLNPSIADDKIEDATIRRCIGFSSLWGYGAMYVGNLYPCRATNPNDMVKPTLEEDLQNTNYLLVLANLSDKIVCAWGTHGLLKPPAMLGKNVWHLGLTAEGYPKHPLRLRKDTPLTEWR